MYFMYFTLFYVFQATAGKRKSLEDISSQSISGDLNLVDLPEEVARHIFGFLSDADLFFKLRCMCRQLHRLVNEYVHLGKTNTKLVC